MTRAACPFLWPLKTVRQLPILCALLAAHTLLVTCTVAVAAPSADVARCAALAGTELDQSKVLHAEWQAPLFIATWDASVDREIVPVAFCRIEGEASAGPGSDIRFEVWLPSRKAWNGRLLGLGASGSLGSINRPDLGVGVTRGFASVATDNGHRGYAIRESDWALGHPERVEDFGYRAHHLATVAAKELTGKFYGERQHYSYFLGCSQGGTKGMMAAQRFPADYDGIVAGAPVYSWANEMTFQAWGFRALTATAGTALSREQMQALYAATAKQCAGPDGLIGDPRECHFDPAVLQCPQASGECLSAAQVTAVRKLYQGPITTSGISILRGLTPGGESSWASLWDLADADPTRSGSWFGVYRFMVFENPKWDPASLDFDRDPALAKRKIGPLLDPDSPDLSAFRARGGKLLVYHGWGDQMVPAQTSTDYHAAVVAKMGGRRKVDGFFRLFMIPGMAHCVGGPGASELLPLTDVSAVPAEPGRDVLVTMQRWVEMHSVPQELVTTRSDERGHVEQTRLVCSEPLRARYLGSGNPRDASRWRCRGERR